MYINILFPKLNKIVYLTFKLPNPEFTFSSIFTVVFYLVIYFVLTLI